MSHIDVFWDNHEHLTVRWEFLPGWKWEEFQVASTLSSEMIASVAHEVDVIFNLNKTFAPAHNAAANLRAASRNVAANVGIRVVVNADGFGLAILRMVIKIFNPYKETPMVFADTVEQARIVIAERRGERVLLPD